MTLLYLYFLSTAAIYTVTFFLSLGYWLFSTHSKQTSSSSPSSPSLGVVDDSNSVPEEPYISGANRFHTIMIIYHTSYHTYHTCYVLQCLNDWMIMIVWRKLHYRLNAAVLLSIWSWKLEVYVCLMFTYLIRFSCGVRWWILR